MLEKIKELFSQYTEVALDENKNLYDLDIDSLDLMNVVLQLEETYHIHFYDDEIEQFMTISDISKTLSEKIS